MDGGFAERLEKKILSLPDHMDEIAEWCCDFLRRHYYLVSIEKMKKMIFFCSASMSDDEKDDWYTFHVYDPCGNWDFNFEIDVFINNGTVKRIWLVEHWFKRIPDSNCTDTVGNAVVEMNEKIKKIQSGFNNIIRMLLSEGYAAESELSQTSFEEFAASFYVDFLAFYISKNGVNLWFYVSSNAGFMKDAVIFIINEEDELELFGWSKWDLRKNETEKPEPYKPLIERKYKNLRMPHYKHEKITYVKERKF